MLHAAFDLNTGLVLIVGWEELQDLGKYMLGYFRIYNKEVKSQNEHLEEQEIMNKLLPEWTNEAIQLFILSSSKQQYKKSNLPLYICL